MNADIPAGAVTPYFGAKAAGQIFLAVLVAYILADVLVVSVLSEISLVSNITMSANRAAALRMAISGTVSPCLMFLITLALLRRHFPNASVAALLGKFGLAKRPQIKLLVGSFVGGIVIVLFFSKVMMRIFPPTEAAPHPANLINYGTVWEKLLFVLSVVVIAPIAEEFLFRGVMYAGVGRSWNKLVSAVLVTLGFIFIHPQALSTGYWLSHLLLYFVAVVLLLVREISGTLFTAILVHSGFNFAIVFF